MSVYATCVQVLTKVRRRCQSSGAGVKGRCEPSDSGAGNWTQPLEDQHVLLTVGKVFMFAQ